MEERPKEILTVTFVDDSKKKIPVSPTTLVRDVIEIIREKLGIEETECYGLAEVIPDGSIFGKTVDRFLNPMNTVVEESVSASSKLVFKLKLYKDPVSSNDPVAEHLYFLQVKQNIVSGTYPSTERHAIRLASYEIQSTFGEYDPKKHKAGYLNKVGLSAYLPLTVSRHDYAYWQERLFSLHSRHKGTTARDARRAYIELARQNPYFGMTFFDVQDEHNVYLKLAVAEDGVYFFFPDMKFRSCVLFKEAVSWGATATGIEFKKKSGGELENFSFIVSDVQTHAILELVNEYFNILQEDDRSPECRSYTYLDYLPPPSMFKAPQRRQFYGAFTSRLELLKNQYMELCARYDLFPARKICRQIDAVIDMDEPLKTFDLSKLELDDKLIGIVTNSVTRTMEYKTPEDEPWLEDLDIETLDLSYNGFTTSGLSAAIPMIRLFPDLMNLNISGNLVGNKGLLALAPALSVASNLCSFEASSADVGNKGIEAIIDVCKGFPGFSRIVVEFNRIGDKAVPAIAELVENNKLSDLSLSGNDLDSKGAELIAKALEVNVSLKSLGMGTSLFGKSGALRIAAALEKNKTLERLDLSGNKLASDVLAKLSKVVQGHPAIYALNLSNNQMGVKLPSEFTTLLKDGHLEELVFDSNMTDINGGNDIAAALKTNSVLRKLSIRDNAIAQKSGALPSAWCDLLTQNTTLEILDLSVTQISGSGISTLLEWASSNSTLRELSIEGNKADAITITGIANYLKANKGVTSLNINGCSLGDAGFEEIAKALSENTTLTALHVRGNGLTLACCEPVAKALSSNTTLQLLDMSQNSIDPASKPKAGEPFVQTSLVPGKHLLI